MKEGQPENLTPPPYWAPPMFDKAELMMIRSVFNQSSFPGNSCAAVGRFIEKCDKLIGNADENCGPSIQPYPMAVDEEKGKG